MKTTKAYVELVQCEVLSGILSWIVHPHDQVDASAERGKLRMAMDQGAFGHLSDELTAALRVPDLSPAVSLVNLRCQALRAELVREQVPFEPIANNPLEWPC